MREMVEAVFKATGVDAMIGNFNRVSESVEGVGDKAESMQSRFGNAGKKMESAGKGLTKSITAPIALLGAGVVKTGVEYENSMAKVQAVTGNTSDEMVELEGIAREMGSTTRYSAGESADALGYMALAGWENHQMVSALPNVLSLATAGNMDLASASDIVTDMMSMFGIEAEDAGRASDVFAEAQSKSNTSVDQLSEALGRAGPSASAVGHSIEDTSAILGVFANQGLKGSAAGTALQAMYRDLQAGAEDGAVAIGKHSVAVYDNEGNMRNMRDIMADVEVATKGMTQEQRESAMSAIFQQQSLRGANLYLNEGSESADNLAESLYNSSGRAQEQAEIMDNTLGGSFQRLKSGLEEVAIQFFEVAEGPMNMFMNGLIKLVDWFGSLSPATQQIIAILAVLAASIGPVLIVVGKMATGVSALIGLWGKLGGAGALLKGAFAALTGPIGLTIAAVVALIAIGVALYKNWDVVKAKAIAIWGAIQTFFSQVGQMIATRFREVWNGIKTFVSNLWEGMKARGSQFINDLKTSFNDGLNAIKTFFSNIWSSIVNGVVNKLTNMQTNAVNRIEAMRSSVVAKITSLQTRFNQIWGNIRDKLFNVLASIFGTSNRYFNNMMNDISNIMNQIYTVIARSFEFVKQTFNNALMFVKGLVTGNFGMMRSAISNQMANIRGIISTIWNAIRNITNSVVSGMVNLVRGLILRMYTNIVSRLNAIRNTFSNIFNRLRSIVSSAFNRVVSAVRNGISRAYGVITGYASQFYNAGRNVVSSIADGIGSALGKITKPVKDVAGKIRDFLPFSPAKEGPLQDLDKLNFGGPITDSIYGAERNVNRAMSQVLSAPDIEGVDVQNKMNKAVKGLESEITYRDRSEGRAKQPAYINFSLGGKQYKGFVDDISNQQGREIDIAEAF